MSLLLSVSFFLLSGLLGEDLAFSFFLPLAFPVEEPEMPFFLLSEFPLEEPEISFFLLSELPVEELVISFFLLSELRVEELKISVSVSPALFPDDPSLDYHNLEGVHNGAEASAIFAAMADMDKSQLEEYREHLLRYCELDTYAMVKVLERLEEIAGLTANRC